MAYRGYPWKWIVTTLGGVTVADVSQYVGEVHYTPTLNTAATVDFDARPDVSAVNRLITAPAAALSPSGTIYPAVGQTNRLLYGFRQEGPPGTAWTIRAAGQLMTLEDQGDQDAPLSHFTAFDPWKYLEGIPAMSDTGALPPRQGFHHLAQTADEIALYYLQNAISFGTWDGASFVTTNVFVDPSPLEHDAFTQVIDFEVARGSSVADVWTNLCTAGLIDIVLTPKYAPTGNQLTNYTHWISLKTFAGDDLPGTVFAWDTLNNTMGNAARQHDATPGNYINTAWYGVGQNGILVPLLHPYAPSGAAVDDFGPWWSLQAITQQADYSGSALFSMTALLIEKRDATLLKQGKRTFTISPIPDRSPVPLHDYFLGDRVTVLTSDNMRVASTGLQRVESIPIVISPDGVETVAGLLCSPDFVPQ